MKILYHAHCADGFGAAYAAWLRFGDEAEYIPVTYGKPPPGGCAGHEVIILDFSYPAAVLRELADVALNVTVIDHHKTAVEELQEFTLPLTPQTWDELQECYSVKYNIYALFDMEYSGAVLGWKFFHPHITVPQLLRHIQDRDLWQFKLSGTREVHALLMSHPQEFEIWDRLARRPAAELVANGCDILRAQTKMLRDMLDLTRTTAIIGGHAVPCANLPPVFASEAGNILAERAPFAATWYDCGDGMRAVSLRSHGAVDVSLIAKQYGGGGHRNAAGFSVRGEALEL